MLSWVEGTGVRRSLGPWWWGWVVVGGECAGVPGRGLGLGEPVTLDHELQTCFLAHSLSLRWRRIVGWSWVFPPAGQRGLMKPQQVRLRLTSLSWGQPWLIEWSVWNISQWLLFPPRLKHSESLLCSSLWEPSRSPGGKNSPKAQNALPHPLHDWASLEFLNLRLVHTEAPGIQFSFGPWQLRFPCPGIGSQEGCGLWVSAPVSHDFLYSPLSVSNLGSSSLSCDLTSAAAAAAAKLLQSCSTLCDPIDGSPPGSPIPGTLQARTLDWVAISFSNAGKWKVKMKSPSHVWLLATPWTAAHQAPPSMGFPMHKCWSGLPFPSPGDLPAQGWNSHLHWQAGSLLLSHHGSPHTSK